MISEKAARRLWNKVDCCGPDECWNWQAGADSGHYGVFSLNGKSIRATRVVWMLTNGPIPKGMFVCHRCDHPPCCNPKHLFLGSPGQNIRDAVSKNRMATGLRHGRYTRPENSARGTGHANAKLTEANVRAIRTEKAAGYSLRQLSAKYGVTRAVITAVSSRRTWKHVE